MTCSWPVRSADDLSSRFEHDLQTLLLYACRNGLLPRVRSFCDVLHTRVRTTLSRCSSRTQVVAFRCRRVFHDSHISNRHPRAVFLPALEVLLFVPCSTVLHRSRKQNKQNSPRIRYQLGFLYEIFRDPVWWFELVGFPFCFVTDIAFAG